MQEDWRLAHERIDKRRIELGLSWGALQKLGNVSQRTFYKMRDDGVPLESEAKRASLSLALMWEADGVNQLLRGEAPAEMSESTKPAANEPLSQRDDDLRSRLESVERGLEAAVLMAEKREHERNAALELVLGRLELVEEQLRDAR